MSNARKPARKARIYRDGYLRSRVWFARREQWITSELTRAGRLECAVCEGPVARDHVELHHLSYAGVTAGDGGWVALEQHDDLVACHRRCHEWLHRLLDSDTALRRMPDRRKASRAAIARLRARLRRTVETLLAEGGEL
ncbi:hypothetical protein OVA26_17130 [Microbacterium sp. SL62]|uniref:hypothetical protein n=1 Tax=Microbacterium sp. SL62 TaxID=2995139 RepID=UPI0022748C00|nr:hypothetical protein [Microbacterium sp. SL62]MCY1718662.1 hypothetical protein [Microbacterium sp. SL62]